MSKGCCNNINHMFNPLHFASNGGPVCRWTANTKGLRPLLSPRLAVEAGGWREKLSPSPLLIGCY